MHHSEKSSDIKLVMFRNVYGGMLRERKYISVWRERTPSRR